MAVGISKLGRRAHAVRGGCSGLSAGTPRPAGLPQGAQRAGRRDGPRGRAQAEEPGGGQTLGRRRHPSQQSWPSSTGGLHPSSLLAGALERQPATPRGSARTCRCRSATTEAAAQPEAGCATEALLAEPLRGAAGFARQKKKGPERRSARGPERTRRYLLSRLRNIIGSSCLTTVFGMGTGMTRNLWSPGVRGPADRERSAGLKEVELGCE